MKFLLDSQGGAYFCACLPLVRLYLRAFTFGRCLRLPLTSIRHLVRCRCGTHPKVPPLYESRTIFGYFLDGGTYARRPHPTKPGGLGAKAGPKNCERAWIRRSQSLTYTCNGEGGERAIFPECGFPRRGEPHVPARRPGRKGLLNKRRRQHKCRLTRELNTYTLFSSISLRRSGTSASI